MRIKSHQMEQLSQKRPNKKDVTAFKRKKNSSDRLLPVSSIIDKKRSMTFLIRLSGIVSIPLIGVHSIRHRSPLDPLEKSTRLIV